MRLRELREQAGLSGYALAKRAGMTTNGYYALEAGTSKPTYDSLMSLARALADVLDKQPSEVLGLLTNVDATESAPPPEADLEVTP